MEAVTIQQVLCFDAVAREGGFESAAAVLGRAHPSVFAAVKNLEERVGFALLDRRGYRVRLTDRDRAFHGRVRIVLEELERLKTGAAQLAAGEESELRIVIGDLGPLPDVLGLLRRFFERSPATRLRLHFEALAGPIERLLDDEADLVIHHVDRADPRLEYVDVCSVRLIPVVAPGFLKLDDDRNVSLADLRDHVQCIIRDTARHTPSKDYYVVEARGVARSAIN